MTEPVREVRGWRWTRDACGAVFFTDNDVANRYCDKCRVFHDDMKVLDAIADIVLAYRKPKS